MIKDRRSNHWEREKRKKDFIQSVYPPLRTKIGKLLKYCRVQSGDEDTLT